LAACSSEGERFESTEEEQMRDEADIRKLLAPAQSRPVDVDGKRFHVERARVVSAILAIPARVDAEWTGALDAGTADGV
jgi:hypothetical protein